MPIAPLNPAGVVQGQRTSANIPAQEIKPYHFQELVMHEPETAELYTYMAAVNETPEVNNPIYTWWEQLPIHRRSTIDGTGAILAATSVGVAAGEGAKFTVGSIWMVESTRELFRVQAVTTDTLGTIQRNIGDTAQAAIPANAVVYEIASAHPEGGFAPGKMHFTSNPYTNNIQIVKDGVGTTGTAKYLESWHSGNKYEDQRATILRQHKRKIQRSLLWGRRDTGTDTVTNTTFWTTGGLDYFISSHIENLNTQNFDWKYFNKIMTPAMKWGEGGTQQRGMGKARKTLVCGARFRQKFAEWGWDKLHFESVRIEELGFEFGTILLSTGTLQLLYAPEFDESEEQAGTAFVVDFNHFKMTSTPGRKTRLIDSTQPGFDGQEEYYATDFGTVVEEEIAHMKLINLPE